MRLLRNNRGQGMTEYIIIVALVAIAAIAGFAYFGKTIRNQTAAMSESVAGNKTDAQAAVTAAQTSAGAAKDEAAAGDRNLKTYVEGQSSD